MSERRAGAGRRGGADTLLLTGEEHRRPRGGGPPPPPPRRREAAPALARQRRRKLASVDKANILSSSRLWREIAHEVRGRFPDVAYEDVLVDAMAMHLIRRPRDFDVI